jgi:hypothetical protein
MNSHTHFSKIAQFEVGDLVRYARHIDSPYVVLIERRAAGLVWNALFPNGAVFKVTWEKMSKID